MMPHRDGVDNNSPPLCKKGKQSDLGVSTSLTQILQRKLLPTSHQLWADMCAFSLGLMVMMAILMMAFVMIAMVMMAMVMMAMVSVMVITVPVAFGQVGWLHHHSHQSFH